MFPNPDTAVAERVGAAQAAINEILTKHRCVIDASFVFAKGRLTPQIFIEALPDEPPADPAPPRKAKGKK